MITWSGEGATLGEGEEGGGAPEPHSTKFWVTLTLFVIVCVPGNSRTAIQSSPVYPDTSATEFRTSWNELQVEFRTAVSHWEALSGSTVICTLQLHQPSLQAREKRAFRPNSQQRTSNATPEASTIACSS